MNLPVVIDLSGLRLVEANWLVEVMLTWIYFHRLYNAQRGEQFRHVIIVKRALSNLRKTWLAYNSQAT